MLTGLKHFPSLRLLLTLTVIGLLMVAHAPAADTLQTPEALEVIPSPPGVVRPAEQLYPAWWGKPPRIPELVPCRDAGHCAACHDANASMDASHAVACITCHGGDSSTGDKERVHVGLIPDPGALAVAERTCGRCHPEEVRRVRRSAMALAPRMINHTRFAFGAQESPAARHATVDQEALKQLPEFSRSGNLGDDLLRRSCLRCHLHAKGSQRWGEHRGLGCSACHAAYPNSADGRPRTHAVIRNVGTTACLKCHNANHVGADFVGLFEKDYQRGFRSPFVRGRQAPRIYGSEQHRLSSDLHFRAGMTCADCHTLDEIHGTNEIPSSPFNHVKISCEGCHVKGDHPAILTAADGQMTLLRGEGRPVPRWNPELIPHRVERHAAKVKCAACHAMWSFQDYGFHLMLEERADYWKWAPLAAQNDPQIQELLARNVGTEAELIPPTGRGLPAKPESAWELPVSRDWLTDEDRPGAWFRGYTERRWSNPPLGLDHRGRVSVMRPMFQYVVSHVDEEGNLLLDRVIPTTGGGFPALIFNPYQPHATALKGRPCHGCHGNPKAAGLGEALPGLARPGFRPLWLPEARIPGRSFRWDALVDEQGTALQRSTHPDAGPLDRSTLERLLNPSARHRALWRRYLTGQGQERP